MVDTFSVCCVLRAGGMPSEEFVSVVENILEGRSTYSSAYITKRASAKAASSDAKKESDGRRMMDERMDRIGKSSPVQVEDLRLKVSLWLL
jgi:hypothetical protein